MKKTLVYVLGGILAAIALAVSLVFILGGNNENATVNIPDLTGNWVVAATYTNNTPTFTENQYMVFKDGTAAMYKDTVDEAYATSAYSINEAAQLLLPDISREYKIDKKTERCVHLCESADQYMLLIKLNGDTLPPVPCAQDDLNGKWNVTMKGDQFNNGEILEFADGTLQYYKAGASEPSAVSEFSLENGVIKVPSLGMEMKCYAAADNTFVLIEQNGIVWELAK